MTALRRTKDAEVEPLTLAEARAHCRVPAGDTTRDAFLKSYIAGARQYAEAYTRRAFIFQTWQLTLDEFPFIGMLHWRPCIDIPISPLAQVFGITYVAQDGTFVDLAEDTDYIVDSESEPARLAPAYGKFWPVAQRRINAVSITFKVGYGADADAVPQDVKNWMLLRVGSLYEHVQENETDKAIQVAPLPFVDALLDPYRAMRV